MKMKKILLSLLVGVVGTAILGVSAMAAGDMNENTADAVASIGDEYYSKVALAMADAKAEDTIVVHKDIEEVHALTAPTVAPLTFKAAANGVKITGRVNLPQTAIDGVVTYEGFDFSGYDMWTVQQYDGPEKLNNLELVFKDCKFGTKGICISWHTDKPDWRLKKLTLDGCTAVDAKGVFFLQYVDEVIIKDCDFSNANDRIVNVSTASGDATVTGTNFGAGSLQLSYNVGSEARNVTVEGCTFAGEKAVVLHEDMTTAETKLDNVLLIDNTVGADTELINFKDEDVDGAAYLTANVESVIAIGNETAECEAVTEVTDGYTPAAPVATVDGVYYTSLAEAIKAADEVDNSVVELLEGTLELEYVKFPANVTDVTIHGNNTVLKNSSLNSSDGGSITYTGITIDNVDFDNSYILFTAGRAYELYSDWAITNCDFYDIEKGMAVQFQVSDAVMTNFTFTGNTITGVKEAAKSGVYVNSSAGTITIANNTISDVNWNAIQLINVAADATVSITGNTLSSGVSEGVINLYNVKAGVTLENNTITTAEGQSAYAHFDGVKMDGKYYASIEAAINAAEPGATITIPAGTYDAFTVPTGKNNLTFVGETDADGNNLVTIRTLEEGIETHTKGIFVQAETATFKNLNFTAGTVVGERSTWMSASIGNTNGDTGATSSLKNLTVENCNFKGSGVNQAIWTRLSNVTVKNSTISGYNKGIDAYVLSDGQVVTIENTEITDVYNAFHTGEAVAGSKINVTSSTIDSDVIDIGGAVAVTITESTISNATVTAYAASSITVTESALYDTAFATNGDSSSVAISAVYANNVNELAAATKGTGVAFTTYYPSEEDLENNANLANVPTVSDYIKVTFAEVTENVPEGEKLYNINLVGANEEVINRLNSADLTFEISNTTGKTAFEIIASNTEVAVAPVNNSTVRYEFHYDGKDGVKTDVANVITIGQVKFTGYGKFTFAVATKDADGNDITTNAAHATTIADNIVDTFIPDGDTENANVGELVIDGAVIDTEILVPTRDLVINIDFPNAVANNQAAYQDMTVTVSGGDLEADLVVELGTNGAVTDLAEYVTKTSEGKAVTAEYADNAYTVTVTDLLNVNTAYTVTVEGAGYRTARYTVTMTEDKTLNFWNNVKDNETVIEEGKKTAKVTYLAGDIVKDGNINIYDLSAVVSYFGESMSTAEYSAYAKYDLNRDGKIDSKDVAYVLVSWNN